MDDFMKTCPSCDGEGRIERTVTCGSCYGMGGRLDIGPEPFGSIRKPCFACEGKGKITIIERCFRCGGTGRVF